MAINERVLKTSDVLFDERDVIRLRAAFVHYSHRAYSDPPTLDITNSLTDLNDHIKNWVDLSTPYITALPSIGLIQPINDVSIERIKAAEEDVLSMDTPWDVIEPVIMSARKHIYQGGSVEAELEIKAEAQKLFKVFLEERRQLSYWKLVKSLAINHSLSDLTAEATEKENDLAVKGIIPFQSTATGAADLVNESLHLQARAQSCQSLRGLITGSTLLVNLAHSTRRPISVVSSWRDELINLQRNMQKPLSMIINLQRKTSELVQTYPFPDDISEVIRISINNFMDVDVVGIYRQELGLFMPQWTIDEHIKIVPKGLDLDIAVGGVVRRDSRGLPKLVNENQILYRTGNGLWQQVYAFEFAQSRYLMTHENIV